MQNIKSRDKTNEHSLQEKKITKYNTTNAYNENYPDAVAFHDNISENEVGLFYLF